MRIGVVVRTRNLWSMTRFMDEKAVLIFMDKVKSEIPETTDINLVNLDPLTPAKRPPEFEPSHKESLYWCPWCGEPRHFIRFDGDFPNILFCEICHISDHDSSTRIANRLVRSIKIFKKRKERNRDGRTKRIKFEPSSDSDDRDEESDSS